MHEHFNAVILKVVKHNDKTQIVDMLTEHHGRMSFAVPAPGTGKNAARYRALWRPLNIIEFECDLKKAKGLPRPKDARNSYVYSSVNSDPLRSMIAMFVDELLCAALWGEVPDEPLFLFVRQSLQLLDNPKCRYMNFHIAFALKLLDFVGLQPNMERNPLDSFFDLRAAVFTPFDPMHTDVLAHEEADWLQALMRMNFRNMHLFKFNRAQISRILNVINRYYMIHVPDFKKLNAADFFRDALSE